MPPARRSTASKPRRPMGRCSSRANTSGSMSIAARIPACRRSVPQPEFPGRLCAGQLRADRRNPAYNPATASYGGIKPANPFSLRRRRLGRLGNRRPRQHDGSQRSARDRNRHRRRTADRLHGGAELVRQSATSASCSTICMATSPSRRAPTSTANAGSKFDAVAMRTQFAF